MWFSQYIMRIQHACGRKKTYEYSRSPARSSTQRDVCAVMTWLDKQRTQKAQEQNYTPGARQHKVWSRSLLHCHSECSLPAKQAEGHRYVIWQGQHRWDDYWNKPPSIDSLAKQNEALTKKVDALTNQLATLTELVRAQAGVGQQAAPAPASAVVLH